jgi:hypothetical protein
MRCMAKQVQVAMQVGNRLYMAIVLFIFTWRLYFYFTKVHDDV